MPQHQTLFIVTTFTKLTKDERFGGYKFGSSRSVGILPSMEEARRIVENNVCDIFETIYEYALIEEIRFGLYPELVSKELYQVEETTVKSENGKEMTDYVYRKIKTPKDFQNYSIVIG